jgi:hypothetical protein
MCGLRKAKTAFRFTPGEGRGLNHLKKRKTENRSRNRDIFCVQW